MPLVDYYTDPNTGNTVQIYTGVTLTGNDLAANTNFQEIADGLSYVYGNFFNLGAGGTVLGDVTFDGQTLFSQLDFTSGGTIQDDGTGGFAVVNLNAVDNAGFDASNNLYLGGANINLGASATATIGGGQLLMAGGNITLSGGTVGTSGDTLGFFGKSAVAQQTEPTAVATTTPTLAAYGFTLAQAQAIIAAVNQLITNGHNLGLTT